MNSNLHAVPATPFTPDALRSALPRFSFSTAMTRDALFQAYRSYYHLNFEQQFAGLKVNAGQVRVGGFDIVMQSFRPVKARGTVLVLHGYYDHVGIFDHLIEALLQNDFAVMTFDLPGHGLSSGVRTEIYSFHQYQPVLQKVVQLMQREMPRPWHLLGQSTGGAIVSEYLLGFSGFPQRLPFASATLLAPLVRPVHWWRNRHVHTVVSRFRDFIPRKFAPSSGDAEFLQFCRHGDPLQGRFLSSKWVGALKQWIPFLERHEPLYFSMLIVQGQQDETVDWHHNMGVLRGRFPLSDILLLPELRHQVVNETATLRNPVFAKVAQFLLTHTTDNPS